MADRATDAHVFDVGGVKTATLPKKEGRPADNGRKSASAASIAPNPRKITGDNAHKCPKTASIGVMEYVGCSYGCVVGRSSPLWGHCRPNQTFASALFFGTDFSLQVPALPWRSRRCDDARAASRLSASLCPLPTLRPNRQDASTRRRSAILDLLVRRVEPETCRGRSAQVGGDERPEALAGRAAPECLDHPFSAGAFRSLGRQSDPICARFCSDKWQSDCSVATLGCGAGRYFAAAKSAATASAAANEVGTSQHPCTRGERMGARLVGGRMSSRMQGGEARRAGHRARVRRARDLVERVAGCRACGRPGESAQNTISERAWFGWRPGPAGPTPQLGFARPPRVRDGGMRRVRDWSVARVPRAPLRVKPGELAGPTMPVFDVGDVKTATLPKKEGRPTDNVRKCAVSSQIAPNPRKIGACNAHKCPKTTSIVVLDYVSCCCAFIVAKSSPPWGHCRQNQTFAFMLFFRNRFFAASAGTAVAKPPLRRRESRDATLVESCACPLPTLRPNRQDTSTRRRSAILDLLVRRVESETCCGRFACELQDCHSCSLPARVPDVGLARHRRQTTRIKRHCAQKRGRAHGSRPGAARDRRRRAAGACLGRLMAPNTRSHASPTWARPRRRATPRPRQGAQARARQASRISFFSMSNSSASMTKPTSIDTENTKKNINWNIPHLLNFGSFSGGGGDAAAALEYR